MEKRALLQNLAAGVLGSLSVGTISVAAEDSDPDEYTTAETAENPVHSTVAFTAIDETERLALYLGTDMETEEDEPAEVQKIISSDDGSVLGIEWQNENELSFNQGIKEKILTVSAGGNVGSIQEADSSSGGDVGINAVIPSLPGGSEEDENYDGGDWGDGTDNSGNTGDGGDDGGSGIGWDGDIGNMPGLGDGSSGGEEDKPDWVNEWENNPDERDQFWDGNANTDGKGLSDLLDGIGLCENSKAGEVCVNFGSMGPKFYADRERTVRSVRLHPRPGSVVGDRRGRATASRACIRRRRSGERGRRGAGGRRRGIGRGARDRGRCTGRVRSDG